MACYRGGVMAEGRSSQVFIPAEQRLPVRIILKRLQVSTGVVHHFGISAENSRRIEIKMMRVHTLDVLADRFHPIRNLPDRRCVASSEQGDETAHVAVLP